MVAIRKRSTANFPKNEHFLTPDTHMYVLRRKKCSSFGKFGLLCFIVIIVLRVSPFLYYQRNDYLFMFKVADVISSWNHDIILYCRHQKSVSGIQTVHITNCLHMLKGYLGTNSNCIPYFQCCFSIYGVRESILCL